MQTMTAREFNQNPSKIQRMVENGPVQVTVRGTVSFIAAKPGDVELEQKNKPKSVAETSAFLASQMTTEELALLAEVPDDVFEFNEGPEDLDFEFELD